MERWIEYRERPSWGRRLGVLAVLAGVGWGGYRLLLPDPAERDALARAIDAIVEEAMEQGPISGVSVAVARGPRVIFARGYGYADLENRRPATAETVYHVGSITKQFTAAAVMQLVEDGSVRLDAPLSEYLPHYPHVGDVTVEQLLNHTSGIANYTTLAEWWETMSLEVTPDRLARSFLSRPLDFAPGTRFAYSNSGYVLLGMIIEAVAGRPYGGYLNAELFVPQRLEATAYCDGRRLVPDRAYGYRATDEGFVHAEHVSMSQAYAAGAVCSSALDLVRWSRALGGGTIVSDEAWERMSSPGELADGTAIEYGYGLAVGYLEGHHRINHVGGMLGFAGQISRYDEDDLTIAVLANTEGANATKIESDIARVLLGLGEASVRDIPLSARELEAYTGRFDLDVAEVDVLARDGRLWLDVTVPGLEGRYLLLNQGNHVFQAADDSEVVLTFTVRDGQAVGFVLLRRGITMRARRMAS